MVKDYGTVEFNGKEYTLKEDAALNHWQGIQGVEENHYSAKAEDAEGNEYTVYWNPKENWQELEDTSDHCEWDEPSAVEKE